MKISPKDSNTYLLSDFSFTFRTGNRYIVFDLEATGPNEAEDNITQMGAIVVDETGPREDLTFVSYVKPRKLIPKFIEELTGVTNELVDQAPGFLEVYEKFREFCGDAILVTQCGYEYDFPLLACECRRSSVALLENERLDTKAIYSLLHPGEKNTFSTNFLSDYYKIDRSVYKRHDALGDARLISRFFWSEIQEAASLAVGFIATQSPLEIKKAGAPIP
jgi:DNA polymerase III alpha subunit (gram-positive type)